MNFIFISLVHTRCDSKSLGVAICRFFNIGDKKFIPWMLLLMFSSESDYRPHNEITIIASDVQTRILLSVVKLIIQSLYL